MKTGKFPQAKDHEEVWVIWSNEHNAYWKPNEIGYTTDIDEAGRYTHDEATKHCKTFPKLDGNNLPPEVMMPAPEAYHLLPEYVSKLAGNLQKSIDEQHDLRRQNGLPPRGFGGPR